LLFGWCCNNLGLVVNEIFSDGGPIEYNLTISVEAPGEGAGGTAKELDCLKNRVRQKVFQSKCPVISGSPVNQDESIAEAANRVAVPKRDINVHSVEVLVFCLIKRFTTVGFLYSCIGTQGRGEFTTIQSFSTVAAD
jgi:hypothetical protein